MSYTLHDLPVVERPRERLVAHGMQSLSSQEVLALILGRGTKGQPVMELSQALLKEFGSLQGISQASLESLQQIHGMGLAKAAQLQACIEVGRRIEDGQPSMAKMKITSAEIVAGLVRPQLRQRNREQYFLLSLDVRNQFIALDKVSEGILDAALVHPRETFEMAIARHAAKIIVCHNHPSGDPQPSDDDLAVTKRLVTAGKVLGITLIDHVIVCKDSFYSLQEHGQI